MKKAPPSPLLMRLDAHIKAERNRTKAGCLRAERAGYVGRLGFFEEAHAELEHLHQEFSRQPEPDVIAWIQVAEGWLAYYREEYSESRDHLMRAYAISTATGLISIRVLSAAWLAYLAYFVDDFEEMNIYLRVAFREVRDDDHLSQTRLCLLFAIAYLFGDRFDLAKHWFTKSRGHATISNDDAALSALNFNMTGRRVTHALIASSRGEDIDDSFELAKVGMNSSIAFDHLLGISLVGYWSQPIQAMVYSVSKSYANAVAVYEAHLHTSLPKGMLSRKPMLLADLSWCYLNVGELEKARTTAESAESLIGADLDLEDQVILYGRLKQLHTVLKGTGCATRFAALQDESNRQLGERRQYILSLLPDMS